MEILKGHREKLAVAAMLLLPLVGLLATVDGPPWTEADFLERLEWRMVAQGTSTALAIVAAAWMVWGSGRLTTRAALSALLMVVVVLIWLLVSRGGSRWLGPRNEYQLLTVATWLGAVGLCAAARRFGIRLVDAAGRPLAGDPRSRQMSLLGLLALMSGVAILLGILRQVMPQDIVRWRPTADDVIRLIAETGASLLVASTLITCFHVPRPGWLNLTLSIGLIAVIAALHIAAYGQLYRMPFIPLDVRMQARGLHFLALTAWLLAAVGALRLCGWRMRRLAPAATLLPEPVRTVAATTD